MQLAKLISFVFHPIIVPIASVLLYFIIIPNHIPKEIAYRILLLVFVSTYILPIFLLFILRKIKLIDNFYMDSIKERKFPVIFYTVLCYLIGNLLLKFNIVDILGYSFMASSLSLALVYILFIFNFKTSLHSLAIAGQIGFIIIISFQYKINLLPLIMALFILLGVISTARLQLKAHTLQEIIIGFFIGIVSQVAVYFTFML
ncbi:hypothetical protein EGM88_11460 [Aureibaculum marinum]|uniref:PAP2 family protein n=1 Tax=Aureibaculum marinum TaxID=2487930 RepID=A0A3N4NHZ8_9FLAO|nr:hypothetical protein [Aureibaculum marinum]RPD95831.1 hypothetical protein EGM88_11460 [Aureibaculum marinum]